MQAVLVKLLRIYRALIVRHFYAAPSGWLSVLKGRPHSTGSQDMVAINVASYILPQLHIFVNSFTISHTDIRSPCMH